MATILARLRKGATDAIDALAEAGGSLATDAADAAAGTRDGVTGAVTQRTDAVTTAVADATDTVSSAASEIATALVDRIVEVADAINERLDDAAEGVGRAGRTTSRSVGKVRRNLDDRVDDLRGLTEDTARGVEATVRDARSRVTDAVPLDEVVHRIERRWPGTDQDRFDRAYQRGYARGRSGRLAVGLAIGATAAAAGTWLLDPEHGAGRRARLAAKARAIGQRVRAEVAARGLALPGETDDSEPKLLPAKASPGAIGEIPSQSGARSTASGTSSDITGVARDDLREPVAAGTVAAEGHETDRGAWHRDVPG